MSNENNTLAVELRTVSGSGEVRRLRRNGVIPAVAYGAGASPVSLSVNADEWKVWSAHHPDGKVTLAFDGKEVPAQVREVQFNQLKNYVVHIDFQLISK